MKQIKVFYGKPNTPSGFPSSSVNEFLERKAAHNPKLHVTATNDNLVVVVQYETDRPDD